MNASRLPSRRPRRRRLLATALLVCVVAGLFAVVNALTLSREAAWLRRQLVADGDAAWSTKMQLSVGSVLLGAARIVVQHVDTIDPQGRAALDAVRRASVGIYKIESADEGGAFDRLAIPEAIPGWTRVVAVRAPDKVVMIYAREPRERSDRVDVAVAVRERRQLVVVSANLAPEGLVGLLARHAPRAQVARAE